MLNQIRRTFNNQKVAKSTLLLLYSFLTVLAFSSGSIVSKMTGLLSIACACFVFSAHYFDDMDTRQAMASIASLVAPFIIGVGCYFIATRTKEGFANTELAALFALGVAHFLWLSWIIIQDGSQRMEIKRQLLILFKNK
jgi:hypothetical protein